MKFNYKFAAIKRIKEIFEKRMQKEVAAIQLEIDRARDEYDDVLKVRMEENKKQIKIISSSDLKFHKNYLISLNRELERIRIKIDQLLMQKELKLEELIQKSKEQKIFSTLEDIHHEEFIKELDKEEMHNLDEIATSRYISARMKSER
jgi:flagellar export protein FliJ